MASVRLSWRPRGCRFLKRRRGCQFAPNEQIVQWRLLREVRPERSHRRTHRGLLLRSSPGHGSGALGAKELRRVCEND